MTETFDVENCRSKLAEHYRTSAKVPTTVWSSVYKVPLDQIYTRLSWVKKEKTPAGPKQCELNHYTELFTPTKNGVLPKRILAQGQTGIGKTTFVKRLTVDWAEVDDAKMTGEEKDVLSKFQLLVAVNLKDVSTCETLTEVIRHSGLFPKDKETSADDLVSYVQGNQESVLLVFDGYDEYRTGKEAEAQFGKRPGSLIYKIFHREYLRDCTVLVTTRPSSADELCDSADKHADITGFDKEDQKTFMRKMLDSESQVDELLKFLMEKNMDDLAKVPLLTLFFCLLWKQEKERLMEVVKTKTKLYRAIVRHVLQYSHKKNFPTQVSRVREENYEEILAEIGKVALESLLKGNQVFEYGQLPEKVRGKQSPIVGLLQISECELGSLEPMEVVSFIHKSIQEYLAAWYITYRCVPEGNLGGIEEHARTLEGCKALENVFLFVCGLSSYGAVKVFKHFAKIKTSDDSLDLSLVVPDLEMDIEDDPPVDADFRQTSFNELVVNSFDEVSPGAEIQNHLFECTGGIVLVTRSISQLLLKLSRVARSWAFRFQLEVRGRDAPVVWLHEFVTCEFLDLFHIPLRISEGSKVFKLGDFLTNFRNVQCGKCQFESILCCRDGLIQFYVTRLDLYCDAHARVLTETAATISVPSLPANLCSYKSCLKFLIRLHCVDRLSGNSMKDLCVIIRNCEHLNYIHLWKSDDYACDLLGNVPNPGRCRLEIGDRYDECCGIDSCCTLTTAGAVKLAGLLLSFNDTVVLELDLTACNSAALITLFSVITHTTLESLVLTGINWTPAAAAELGRRLPELSSLEELELSGTGSCILKAEEMMASLFDGFDKTLPLQFFSFRGFIAGGNLAPLTKSFRFFPELEWLFLSGLGTDERDLCGLLESLTFIPGLYLLAVWNDPQIGHAVASHIVPLLTNLPKLQKLDLVGTVCSEEDKSSIQEAVKQVRPQLQVEL